ncbi:MAG: glycosyltransferase family 1 protein [Gemmatales bacterium]
MRIAVDARQVYRKNRRGIGKALLQILLHISSARPNWEFRLFHQSLPADNPFAFSSNNLIPERIDITGDRFGFWQEIRLPLAAWQESTDLIYSPANIGPCKPCRPMAVSVHDLIPLQLEPTNATHVAWGRKVARTIKSANRVHTVSEYSARQLHDLLGVPAAKIEVIPLAADPQFIPVTDMEKHRLIREKYCISNERPYVLAFGAADERKNTRRIIEAWSRLPLKIRDRFFLLILGIQDASLPIFREFAYNLIPNGGWHLHGYADEADLPTMLSAATLLCYPSLAEGFGLPILEAFSCGTAVLTSNITSLPEVAGDAALLINPLDTASLVNGLHTLLTDDNYRSQLAERGKIRSSAFTWHKTSEQMAELFSKSVPI